jgi:hypothetical protein
MPKQLLMNSSKANERCDLKTILQKRLQVSLKQYLLVSNFMNLLANFLPFSKKLQIPISESSFMAEELGPV